jgi:ABC-2 type transport system permease protein
VNKIRAIALREYFAAVQARAFLITLLLMPVLMGGSIAVSILFKKLDEAKEKKYALIDRTADKKMGTALKATVAMLRLKNPKGLPFAIPKATFEDITPSPDTPEAMHQQRFEISQRIDRGELEGLIEIGPDALKTKPGGLYYNAEEADESGAIRFQTKGVTSLGFARMLGLFLNPVAQMERFQNKGLTLKDFEDIQQPLAVQVKSLTQRNPKTGELEDAADETRFVNLFLPAVLIGLMFMMIMVGATPAMHGIIEEKSLRIAEVLLGSVTPFQLMAGKLLGIVGVALTLATVYLGGGYFLVTYFGLAEMIPLSLLLWVIPMLILALLIFGSLFIAVGAAASDIKDTQTLLMPIMLLATIPFFALGPIMQDPNGPIARVCSFFPFATPMLLVARQSVPPGVPLWEMLAGIALVLATTLLCLWAAGRIFRIGILLHGKTPSFGDLVRWVVRG